MADARGVGAWRDSNFGEIGGQMKRSLLAVLILLPVAVPLGAKVPRRPRASSKPVPPAERCA